MPHEGNADPVTNDGPRFHSDISVRELTERITRTCPLASSPSASLEPSRQATLAQPLRLRKLRMG